MSIDRRKEALLNEYKGNVFEFLVASSLSRQFELEDQFLKNLPPAIFKMLRQQEAYIRQFYPELIKKLPLLAENLARHIDGHLQVSSVDSIELVGKYKALSQGSFENEADIVLQLRDKEIPLSIKLNKFGAATNTKSGGIKSFLMRYFGVDEKTQEDLNTKVDLAFDEFSFALHEEYGIEWDRNFNEWVTRGLPTLPGELDPKGREIYLQLLYKLRDLYLEEIQKLRHSEDFVAHIYALIGFSHSDIVQCVCFHKDDYSESLNQVHSNAIKEREEFTLEGSPQSSLFNIRFADLVLQIRIKAMNKFINKSFKVNCAVKITRASQ